MLVRLLIASSQLIGLVYSQRIFDVFKYGAVGDERTDDSKAFVTARGELCGAVDEANLLYQRRKHFYCSPSSLKCGEQILGKLVAPKTMDTWKGCDDWLQFSNVGNLLIDGLGENDGDDCIAINGGCSDLNIANIAYGPGHGISVGSLGANGALEKVNNVYVKDCSFSGTTNGARIKTWQGGSGYARNITFEKITLDAAKNPIIIDQFYCDRDHYCKSQPSTLSVDYVKYIDFEGTSVSEEAI
ncbi:hypothetical protein L3X38_016030 [Prunus dulcis]|uniref:Pectin lyase-like superfamily protein n=1 Tax=Prunus dulcis TaxID=3755 RepID=A0AAD4W6B1_PRUDU|nr:hypothetical protein L3X38_016030 [Prunus dulcis]